MVADVAQRRLFLVAIAAAVSVGGLGVFVDVSVDVAVVGSWLLCIGSNCTTVQILRRLENKQ